jgi:hypothetical protein
MTSRMIAFSKSISLLISLSMIATLVGCSSSSNHSGGGGGTTPTVSLSNAPASLSTGGKLSITATVTNDSGNGGVTWSCTPGNSAATCGSFSASKSASGTAVSYTAPSAAASVVIIATVVDDTSVTASTPTITVSSAPAITVTLSTPPPSSLAPSGTATIAATVANDSANKGVTWSCSPAATCGSFNPTGTASAATTVFTAGSATGNVVITATSVTATSVSASANVNITTAASGALSQGSYTFWLSGWDANNSAYYVAGAFVVDGSGNITAGEQDFIDEVPIVANDQLNVSGCSSGGSCISKTSDGNLQISLVTADTGIGVSGVETLNATLTSSSSARIIEFDSSASGSGQLEPQTIPTTTPLGGYAFSVSGFDSSALPLGIGGVINVDTAGNISGSGSVFDENDAGNLMLQGSFAASTVGATPDGSGRVVFTLSPSGLAQVGLVGYFVNGSHLRLVETSDALFGTTGGQAFLQSGTGGFTTSSFEGSSYVFGATGVDNTTNAYFLQTAGVVTGNSDGSTVSGNVSFNDLVNISNPGGATIAAGTYTVDTTGRVTLSGLSDNVTFSYNFELYLDGNGNARVLALDANDVMDGVAGLQNLPTTPFNGTFAMGAAGADTISENPLNAVGPLVSDGSAGTFSGFADLNWIFNPTPPGPTLTDEPVSGTFSSATGAGISSGTITGIDVTDCPVYTPGAAGCTADAFTYYVVSPSQAVGIESDANQLTLIRFELQQ